MINKNVFINKLLCFMWGHHMWIVTEYDFGGKPLKFDLFGLLKLPKATVHQYYECKHCGARK